MYICVQVQWPYVADCYVAQGFFTILLRSWEGTCGESFMIESENGIKPGRDTALQVCLASYKMQDPAINAKVLSHALYIMGDQYHLVYHNIR